MPTYVLGHINPDTDSTCSAISAAWLLNELQATDATPRATGALNKETQFVLDHFGIETPELISELHQDEQFFLVDTNNPEELIPGYADATLMGVIDHHKLVGGLSTPAPILFRIEPVACTSTVLYEIAARAELTIPKPIAGLMLACIVSDTLKFTSPTTTDADRRAAEKLAEISGESIDALADGMFTAKSDLTGMSTTDILMVDSKIFTLSEKRMRVSVLETTKPDFALNQKAELLQTMISLKNEESLDGCFLFVVDILSNSSTLLLPDAFEQVLSKKAFSAEAVDNQVILPGVVSRKKQMVPAIETALL